MIFVDTGAFVARYLMHDQHHAGAVDGWRKIQEDREPCMTSNLVLAETFTLLARRAGYAFAAEKARLIYASPSFTVVRPTEKDEHAALDWFEKFADQQVSFTDCVSFALMRKRRVSRVFAFDRHFELAGFQSIG